jgi:hypothetical protein
VPRLVVMVRMIRFTHCEVAPHGDWLPSAVITVVKVTAPYGAKVPVQWLWMTHTPAVHTGGAV